MAEPSDDLLGWATSSLIQIDATSPGTLRRVLAASPMRRQAIFSVLARHLAWDGQDTEPCDADTLGQILGKARARDILAGTFDTVPDGWLGALHRIGGRPLIGPSSYIRLHCIFADRSERRRATALRHIGLIDDRVLRVLDALDDHLVHVETQKRLRTATEAQDFNRAVVILKSVCSAATDEAIAAGIERLPPSVTLDRLLSRFLARADCFPQHPIAGDDDLRPLETARQLHEVAVRFQNCLKTRVGAALAGRAAFAEFRHDDDLAILEFRPLTAGFGWLLHEVHVKKNGLVPVQIQQAAEQKCASLGVPSISRPNPSDDWRRLNRFMGRMERMAWVT